MQPTTEQQTETARPQVDLYQKLTDTVISHLEAGHTPWQKSWNAGAGQIPAMPKNIISGKDYTGINTLLLWCASLQYGYASHEWAGFRQWKQQEENIRKGEKGTTVVYYATEDKDENAEAPKSVLKSYVVFHRCQLSSYQPGKASVEPSRPLAERLAEAAAFAAHTKAVILHKGKKALYDASKDEIHLPKQASFQDCAGATGAENYYSELFRELVHWTGHPQRLDRSFDQRFSEQAPVAEAITTALGTAFLCAEFNISPPPLKSRSATLAGWTAALQQNKYLVTAAATAAWKAVDYLRQLQPQPGQ